MKNILLLIMVVSFGVANNAFGAEKLTPDQLNQKMSDTLEAIISAASRVNATVSSVTQATTIAAAMPKDNNEWTGDHLQIHGNLYGLKKGGANSSDATYFAPAYVRFDVSRDENGTVEMTPRANFTVDEAKHAVVVEPASEHGLYGYFAQWLTKEVNVKFDPSTKVVDPHESYTISKQDIEKILYVKYGWTYGALVVPYKYQRGYKVVNSSPSAQMYVGYKRDANGNDEGPFMSAGLSSADVPTATGQSSTKLGFSYGLGWIFEIKKNKGVQLIIIAGQDVFGSNSGYQYEGDVWYSMSIGLSLDNSAAK